jgi:molybdate transport system substrate-binding protein
MLIFALGLILLFAAFTIPADAEEVRISAAASLTDAVKELVIGYQRQYPEIKLLPNFASSGALAKQIYAGAPADIYISANPKWMDYLQQQALIDVASEQVLVQNSLVFVGVQPLVSTISELPKLHRIALGSPKSTPVGRYAEQALSKAGLYSRLLTGQKLILAKDVRQALLYAERGEVDGAFVYRSDALLAKQAKILFAVPQELYSQVVYPAALTKTGIEKSAAKQFFAYLHSNAAQQIFRKYGFLIAE